MDSEKCANITKFEAGKAKTMLPEDLRIENIYRQRFSMLNAKCIYIFCTILA